MEMKPESNKSSESPTSAAAFEPPRHWVDLEELKPEYWADPKTREKRGQEFFEKPVELLEKLDQSGQGGMARREFLTIMGASMALATTACARRPVNKIIPYVVKPEEITPGVSNYYTTVCTECPAACGVLTKNREGRPIKLEGNPTHPVNAGALCARGQASLLNLYDPDRLKAPLVRSRAVGGRREATWAEVDAEISGKLKAIAAKGGRVHVLSGATGGETTRRLIGEFVSAFGGRQVQHEPLLPVEIAEAQRLSYGEAVIPAYRFDKAEVVVSLGADFIGGWLSPVEHAAAWSKGRKLDGLNQPVAHAEAKLSKLYCFESAMTLTGANADERFPVRPGDELAVALALAHELLVVRKLAPVSAEVAATLQGHSIDATVSRLPRSLKGERGAAKLREVAEQLAQARGKSLVVAGGLHSQGEAALELQLAVNLLNSSLGNEGVTVDASAGQAAPVAAGTRELRELVEEMSAGQVDALVVYRCNPAYTARVEGLAFEAALKKVPLVIVAAERETETARLADYVVTDHHPLENWGDASPRKGVWSLQQPAIAPLGGSRAFQDSLLTWIKGGDLLASGKGASTLARAVALAAAPPVVAPGAPPPPPPAPGMSPPKPTFPEANTWYAYLRASWKQTIHPALGKSAEPDFLRFWEQALREGVVRLEAAPKPASRSFRPVAIRLPSDKAEKEGAEGEGSSVRLALYAKGSMGDGRSSNNAWLQELPDPLTAITWDNYLNVSPELAERLGLANDHVVEVSAGQASCELPVHVQVGLDPSVVTAAIGYGRRSAGKVGDGAGVDVFPLAELRGDRLVFSGRKVQLRKTGRIYRLASTQWHTVTENRPIINDITLTEYRQDPETANHTRPHLRMKQVPTLWPVHQYKTQRWGMTIDLNSCTGCSACMVACQAENNIPVVGRDQVRVSRQMHWIKIDRYFSGSPENPGVVFQPMLCQHCENAPCETVCPVLATVHDDQGLNVQVYNRCVGTRYCQNNCPYKVRRFNFFDHWKSYEGPMSLVWNPDVSVRQRGVMEKCTFCVQRIREAREKAKDATRSNNPEPGVHIARVKDGDLKTACQQTCPTNAIVFGDMNDPTSRVSKLRAEARAFRVLEEQNTKPSISYLTKVRNKAPEAHGHGAKHGAAKAHEGGASHEHL